MTKTKLRLGDEPVDFDGAMTFEEIGRELGISRGGAWMLYCSGIRKLRRKVGAMRELRKLAAAREDSF
jgi:hypothetical protein